LFCNASSFSSSSSGVCCNIAASAVATAAAVSFIVNHDVITVDFAPKVARNAD
jgi:hypothetical protein